MLKPTRIRNSLYLLIPMEVAKLTGVTKDTRFKLTLQHTNNTLLVFEKVHGFVDPSIDRNIMVMRERPAASEDIDQAQIRTRAG